MFSNRKAQIGKFLTGFVSFLLIVLLIGIFIALSAYMAKVGFGSSSREEAISFSRGDRLALQEIEVDIEGKKEKMLITDAVIFNEMGRGRNVISDLQQFFRKEAEKDKGCILFSAEGNDNYFRGYYRYKAGEVQVLEEIAFKGDLIVQSPGRVLSNLFRDYNGKGALQKAEVEFIKEGERMQISLSSYSGRCLDGGDNNE